MVGTTSSLAEETPSLSERDFEDITSKLENRKSKRLRDTELRQRKILRLIENLFSKVLIVSSTSLEQRCSNSRIDYQGGFSDVSISDSDALNGTRNTSQQIVSNKIPDDLYERESLSLKFKFKKKQNSH